jgi:hypothetical protein
MCVTAAVCLPSSYKLSPGSSLMVKKYRSIPTQSFYAMQVRTCGQAAPAHRTRVTLSKEAYAAITTQCHENSQCFRSALNDAWDGLDKTVKTIASSHHKSFHHVQNDRCLGCGLMRFRHSKLNAWNAFCWKKCQENDGHGMYFYY